MLCQTDQSDRHCSYTNGVSCFYNCFAAGISITVLIPTDSFLLLKLQMSKELNPFGELKYNNFLKYVEFDFCPIFTFVSYHILILHIRLSNSNFLSKNRRGLKCQRTILWSFHLLLYLKLKLEEAVEDRQNLEQQNNHMESVEWQYFQETLLYCL